MAGWNVFEVEALRFDVVEWGVSKTALASTGAHACRGTARDDRP